MSSTEWLSRHGVLARRLGFYDVLAGAAFKHEDGVLDLMVAPPCKDDEVMDAVSSKGCAKKNCTPTVSQQIVLQCVPVKLVLSDLSVTFSIAQAHSILDYY